MVDADCLAIGIEAHVSLIMESDGLTTAAYTGTDKAIEDLNHCSILLNLQEGCEGKEMDATGDMCKNDAQGVDHGESLKLQGICSHLAAADGILERNDPPIVNGDTFIQDNAAGLNEEASEAFILDVDCVKQDVADATFVSCPLLHQVTTSPESFREEDTDRELSDLTTPSGESWKQMTYDSDTEEDNVKPGRKRTYSDLSTLRAESTDRDASSLSLVNSNSFTLDAEAIEAEVDADGIHLPSYDSLSSDIELMDAHDIGIEDFSLVPMDSLHVSLVSNNSQTLNEIGAGSAAFHSFNFSIAGADWHIASPPVKCLEMGAVNVASLTLGTVGISVIPFVSPGTIDINPITSSMQMVPIEPNDWETWSMDSMSLAASTADYVNVDSITPEGVRECWHPLEERLCALGEALTALDKKLEGFSPRIQEAETMLNEVELSFSQHAMHISDIMKENNALAERVLLLEERLSREKQQQQIWVKKSEEET